MSDVFIERRPDKTYRATQNKRTIGTGDTQEEAIDEARENRQNPDDPMFAGHVRNTGRGRRDKWRRVY
jgi:hypothetical protein